MNIDEIKDSAPSVLRTKKQGASPRASDKYEFIPTLEIIKDLSKLGWEVYSATQQNSKKNPDTTKHMVRFRNMFYGRLGHNGNVPEIILVNSHDTTSSFRFYVGLFRVVCANGLIVADEMFNELKVKHIWYKFEDVSEIIGKISSELPRIFETIGILENTELSKKQIKDFAMQAYSLRYPEHINPTTNKVNRASIEKEMDVEQLITCLRPEDKGTTAWAIFNRIQENLINGNYNRIGSDDKLKKARPLSNIRMNLLVNSALWNIATDYIK